MGQHNLPSGYIELKYIASTNTGNSTTNTHQWIDTGLYNSATDIIMMRGRFYKWPSNSLNVAFLFGNHNNSAYRRAGMVKVNNKWRWFAPTGYNNESASPYTVGNGLGDQVGAFSGIDLEADLDTHVFIYDYVRNSFTIDDTEYPLYNGLNDSSSSRHWPAPIYPGAGSDNEGNTLAIFAYKQSTTNRWPACPFKLEECIITQNATTVRDFIPALRKSDLKPGLYDLVTNAFFTNAVSSEYDFAYELESYKAIIPLNANGTSKIENYKTNIDTQAADYKTVIYNEGE